MLRQLKRKRTVTQANVKKVKSNAVSNGGSRRSSRSIKRRQKEENSEEEKEEEDDGEEEEDSEEEESEDESEPVAEIKYVLTDAHRAFNQRLLAEAVMTYTKADELKAEVVEAFKKQTNDDSDSSDDDEEENSLANKSLDNMIEDTNSFLSKYQIQIKQSKYDGLGEEYIGFANNNGSTTEKILTKMYDEGTVKLLEELIDACIDSPTGTVSPDVAKEDFYSIRNRHPKIKERITIANCLHRLKEDKWIKLGSQDGLYRLGPRAFVELKDYLESKGAMKSRGQIYITDKSMLTRAPRA